MGSKTKARVAPKQHNSDKPHQVAHKPQPPPHPVCPPVVQSPPAQLSTEAWADALPPSNSTSFMTAESDELLSPTAAPSTAAGADAVSQHAPVEPPSLAELTQAAFEASLLPPCAVEGPEEPAAADVGTAPGAGTVVDTCSPVVAAAAQQAEAGIAADPQPLPEHATNSAAAAAPVAEVPAPAAASGTQGTETGAAGWPGSLVDWLLRAYTYPVYLAAGVTVGLVTGVLGVAGRKVAAPAAAGLPAPRATH